MDGFVTIGTKIDTKQLETDLKTMQKDLQKSEKENEKLLKSKATAEVDLTEYYKQVELIKEATNEEIKYAQTQKEVNSATTSGNKLLSNLNTKYSTQLSTYDDINSKITANIQKQETLTNKIDETNTKLNTTKADFSGITSTVSSGTSKIVKNVAKWALAVFGVRSVYLGIRSAISTLSTYNEQLATDIDYITFAVSTILEPVIENLVSLVYKLLYYANQVAIAWFGIDLFANSSADGMSSAADSAADIKKSLAGFDEMNVISDTSSSSSESATAPSYDLSSNIEEFETPAWLQWIMDNKAEVIAGILGISSAILVLNVALAGLKISLNALGIGLIIAGLVLLVQYWTEFIENPSVQTFLNVLMAIALIIAGIALLFSGWTVLIIALGVALVAFIANNWDAIVEFFANLGEEVNWAVSWLLEKLNELLLWVTGKIEDGLNAIVDFFWWILEKIGDFFVWLWTKVCDGAGSVWTKIKEIFGAVSSWIYEHLIKPVGDFFSGLWDGFKDGASSAWDGIKNIFSNVTDFFSNIFSNAWEAVKNVFSTGGEIFSGITDGILSGFKSIVNKIIDGINTVIAVPFKGINYALDKIRNISLFGATPFDFISTISIPEIPNLAVGGIVNMPGTGIPLGGANVGEAGAEGVIPLTDSQAMQALGEAIGRYIVLNIDITNTMNGRVLNRELQKIQNNNDFASNR